jgi:uncharacterized protein (DUF1330 family)
MVMRNLAALGLTLAVGIVIGAWGVPMLRAQTAAHPAYLVAEVHVTDPAGFTDYLSQLPATMAPYHVKTLARGLPDVREGTPPDGQVVILGFNSLQDANRWYESPEYQKIIPIRQKAATTRLYIVDGLAQ